MNASGLLGSRAGAQRSRSFDFGFDLASLHLKGMANVRGPQIENQDCDILVSSLNAVDSLIHSDFKAETYACASHIPRFNG